MILLFDNYATGNFLRKIFPNGTPSGLTGSNDTGFKFLSCLGADSIVGHTHTRTELDRCKIPNVSIELKTIEIIEKTRRTQV